MKKEIKLSIDKKLLNEAGALAINLSEVSETAICKEVRNRQAEAWKKRNRKFLQSYDDHIEKHGVFSEKLRVF